MGIQVEARAPCRGGDRWVWRTTCTISCACVLRKTSSVLDGGISQKHQDLWDDTQRETFCDTCPDMVLYLPLNLPANQTSTPRGLRTRRTVHITSVVLPYILTYRYIAINVDTGRSLLRGTHQHASVNSVGTTQLNYLWPLKITHFLRLHKSI